MRADFTPGSLEAGHQDLAHHGENVQAVGVGTVLPHGCGEVAEPHPDVVTGEHGQGLLPPLTATVVLAVPAQVALGLLEELVVLGLLLAGLGGFNFHNFIILLYIVVFF
ncbi:hypothetical protein PG984_008969 [Apiospora sp. TS-2023a]